MAEFASNLNQAHKNIGRPSIFDLLAQESLQSSLRPAFEFFTNTLANTYPEFVGPIFKYSDEIFYSILGVIERHYIWKYGASFAEHFYSLRRVNGTRGSDGSLSLFQKVASLCCLLALPYLRCKATKLYQKIKENTLSGQCRIDSMQFAEKYFFQIFPYVDSLLEATKLLFTICYIIKLVGYHSLTHMWLKILLAYSSQELPSETKAQFPETFTYKNGVAEILRFVYQQVKRGFSFFIENVLPMSVFFLKFLEWWYSSDENAHQSMNVVPTPPPPTELEVILNFCWLECLLTSSMLF